MDTCSLEDMLGRKVSHNGREYTIGGWMVDASSGAPLTMFRLDASSRGRKGMVNYIPTTSFEQGRATTDDPVLEGFVRGANTKYHNSLGDTASESPVGDTTTASGMEDYLEGQSTRGTQQGREDARRRNSALYRVLTCRNPRTMERAGSFTREFRDAYIVAYEDERAQMKRERLIASRSRYSTLDMYEGDLDILLGWMRDNLLRVEVFASPDKIGNEQMAVDAINERDGTNYQVRLRPGQYVSYEAYFRNPSTAPVEFLTWKVSKHDYTTSDLNRRVMAHPMDIRTGKMTCNALVRELVYNSEYAFHLGKASI